MQPVFKRKYSDEQIPLIAGFLLLMLAIIFFYLISPQYMHFKNNRVGPLLTYLYMVPIFFPFGYLIGNAILKIIKRDILLFSLILELILIAAIAMGRLIYHFPLSGHSLLIGYYLPFSFQQNEENRKGTRVVSILLLLQIVIFKILLLEDCISLLTGLIAGSFIWIIFDLIKKLRTVLI